MNMLEVTTAAVSSYDVLMINSGIVLFPKSLRVRRDTESKQSLHQPSWLHTGVGRDSGGVLGRLCVSTHNVLLGYNGNPSHQQHAGRLIRRQTQRFDNTRANLEGGGL